MDKLITSLRTAVDNDGAIDKESTSYNDIYLMVSDWQSFIVLKIAAVKILLILKKE
jgi:hypothetical protein